MRVDPIRLGPDRHAAISIQSSGHGGAALEIGESQSDTGIDWPRALQDAGGFSPDEIELFQLKYIAVVPQAAVMRLLRWHGARLAKVTSSLAGKVPMRLGQLRQAVRHQLDNAIPSIDANYAEIMAKERLKPTLQILSSKNRATMIPKTQNLDEQLTGARRRLAELQRVADDAGDLVRSIQARVAEAEATAKAEHEEALIADRTPSAKIISVPEQLQAELKTAVVRRNTADGAVTRQRDRLEAIESEISATRNQRALAAMMPKANELAATLDRAADLAEEIFRIKLVHGADTTYNDIFPGERDQSAVDLRMREFIALLDYARYERLFSGNGVAA